MAACATCGAENREGARFCDECGAGLAAPPAAREQRKVVTVLFCDVTGSTSLGERLDPESLRALLARYFERMKTIVERHGGTVEKFIGDAVMAVFGVPAVHEDDALRALRAAQEMRVALPELGVEGRIGVMTGEVVTGTDERLATGDAVNVAARLEQAAQPGEVLIGAETLALTRDAVDVQPVEPLELKGKSAPVEAFRLVAVRAEGEGFARRLDAPMVGRETELRRLRDAFDQAVRDRSCQLFTVLGAAGVGKSRLTAAFLETLEGVSILRGRCLPYGEGITYWPVVEVVKQLEKSTLDDAAANEAIRSVLGEGTSVASAPEIAWAFRKLLESAAADRPLVCVFDDLHWGEETFLDLVEHVSDLSREAPILLLCMARPDLLDRRPAWGGGKLNATTVLLEPLGAEDSERLLESLGALSAPLRDRIRTAAEGNPLFLEQMVALVQDAAGGEIVVPPTIQALLAARLDQLDPSERGVLEAGSVEGRLFHRGAVQALTEEEATPRLTALVRKELVRPDKPQIPGDDAFRFRHLLIRDAAYDALPKAVRADLHAQFADWLETNGRELVELDEILGYHLEQAARYRAELGREDGEISARASARLAAAGRRALARLDFAAAVSILERAVALLPEGGYDANLELDLASGLFYGGRPGEIEALVTSLAERAAPAGDRGAVIRAQLNGAVARAYVEAGAGIDDLEELVRAVLPELEEIGDPRGLCDAWSAMSLVAHSRLRNAEKLDAAERALSYAREAGDERRLREVLPYLVNAHYFGPTPAAEGLAWLEEQEASGLHHPAFDAHRVQFLTMLGRVEEARAIHERDHARWEQFGPGVPMAISCIIRMEVEQIAGDFEAAYEWGRRGCDLMEAMGHTSWLSTMSAELGNVLCELGRYDEAASLADRSRELAAEDDIATQVYAREVQAKVLAERGETDAAEEVAREAVELAMQTDNINAQAEVLLALGGVLARAGRHEQAVEAWSGALTLFEQKGNVTMVRRTRALM